MNDPHAKLLYSLALVHSHLCGGNQWLLSLFTNNLQY